MVEISDETLIKRKDITNRLFDGKIPTDNEIIHALEKLSQKESIEELCISGILSDGHEKDVLKEILSIVVSTERFADIKKLVDF